MKRVLIVIYFTVLLNLASAKSIFAGCATCPLSSNKEKQVADDSRRMALQNLQRSMDMIDLTIGHFFDSATFEMRRFYNPFTQIKSEERASVWMYTSAIEAVNTVLAGLKSARQTGRDGFYDNHFERYVKLLDDLYVNAEYYLGTFELVSFTQTKKWSVYAVNRSHLKGQADVSGILNVYDDQMWLIRELLDSYKLTENTDYLEKAEYLTAYVLDGWDVTRNESGKENGGIPWGPGYTTKHACSNGPLISPLVWLHELYKDKPDRIERRSVDENDRKTRRSQQVEKRQYYLDYARAIYDWQQSKLLNADGVYADMMGGCVPNCDIQYEEVRGVQYKANTPLSQAVGKAYTYNSGTMLSAAMDLYGATREENYAADVRKLAKSSFGQFASLGKDIPEYYSFGTEGFESWFNGILIRSYYEAISLDPQIGVYLTAFQRNLDYGFEHFNHEGFLPTNLLRGWTAEIGKRNVEGMFMFSYASQYAILGKHQLESNS